MTHPLTGITVPGLTDGLASPFASITMADLKRFAKNLTHSLSRNAVLHPCVARVPPIADV